MRHFIGVSLIFILVCILSLIDCRNLPTVHKNRRPVYRQAAFSSPHQHLAYHRSNHNYPGASPVRSLTIHTRRQNTNGNRNAEAPRAFLADGYANSFLNSIECLTPTNARGFCSTFRQCVPNFFTEDGELESPALAELISFNIGFCNASIPTLTQTRRYKKFSTVGDRIICCPGSSRTSSGPTKKSKLDTTGEINEAELLSDAVNDSQPKEIIAPVEESLNGLSQLVNKPGNSPSDISNSNEKFSVQLLTAKKDGTDSLYSPEVYSTATDASTVIKISPEPVVGANGKFTIGSNGVLIERLTTPKPGPVSFSEKLSEVDPVNIKAEAPLDSNPIFVSSSEDLPQVQYQYNNKKKSPKFSAKIASIPLDKSVGSEELDEIAMRQAKISIIVEDLSGESREYAKFRESLSPATRNNFGHAKIEGEPENVNVLPKIQNNIALPEIQNDLPLTTTVFPLENVQEDEAVATSTVSQVESETEPVLRDELPNTTEGSPRFDTFAHEIQSTTQVDTLFDSNDPQTTTQSKPQFDSVANDGVEPIFDSVNEYQSTTEGKSYFDSATNDYQNITEEAPSVKSVTNESQGESGSYFYSADQQGITTENAGVADFVANNDQGAGTTVREHLSDSAVDERQITTETLPLFDSSADSDKITTEEVPLSDQRQTTTGSDIYEHEIANDDTGITNTESSTPDSHLKDSAAEQEKYYYQETTIQSNIQNDETIPESTTALNVQHDDAHVETTTSQDLQHDETIQETGAQAVQQDEAHIETTTAQILQHGDFGPENIAQNVQHDETHVETTTFLNVQHDEPNPETTTANINIQNDETVISETTTALNAQNDEVIPETTTFANIPVVREEPISNYNSGTSETRPSLPKVPAPINNGLVKPSSGVIKIANSAEGINHSEENPLYTTSYEKAQDFSYSPESSSSEEKSNTAKVKGFIPAYTVIKPFEKPSKFNSFKDRKSFKPTLQISNSNNKNLAQFHSLSEDDSLENHSEDFEYSPRLPVLQLFQKQDSLGLGRNKFKVNKADKQSEEEDQEEFESESQESAQNDDFEEKIYFQNAGGQPNNTESSATTTTSTTQSSIDDVPPPITITSVPIQVEATKPSTSIVIGNPSTQSSTTTTEEEIPSSSSQGPISSSTPEDDSSEFEDIPSESSGMSSPSSTSTTVTTSEPDIEINHPVTSENPPEEIIQTTMQSQPTEISSEANEAPSSTISTSSSSTIGNTESATEPISTDPPSSTTTTTTTQNLPPVVTSQAPEEIQTTTELEQADTPYETTLAPTSEPEQIQITDRPAVPPPEYKILAACKNQDYYRGLQEPSQTHYPWLATVVGGTRPFCSATLITNQHVLTAAHFLSNITVSDVYHMRVHIGYRASEDGTTMGPYAIRKVIKVVRHKGFSFEKLYNDIAILILDRPVHFNDNISPVCLSSGRSNYSNGFTDAIETGWVEDPPTKHISKHHPFIDPQILKFFSFGYQNVTWSLQEATNRVRTNEECRANYSFLEKNGIAITKSMVCAGSLEGKSSACGFKGNSGAPLFVPNDGRPEQIGIVSWGIGCGHFPSVFTRISSFIPWIERVVFHTR